MFTDESKGIQEFIVDRLCKIHETILDQDEEYRALVKASAELLDQLLTAAGLGLRNKVDAFDCGWALRMNRQDELVYGQGLIDGIILANWVERVCRSRAGLGELLDG